MQMSVRPRCDFGWGRYSGLASKRASAQRSLTGGGSKIRRPVACCLAEGMGPSICVAGRLAYNLDGGMRPIMCAAWRRDWRPGHASSVCMNIPQPPWRHSFLYVCGGGYSSDFKGQSHMHTFTMIHNHCDVVFHGG